MFSFTSFVFSLIISSQPETKQSANIKKQKPKAMALIDVLALSVYPPKKLEIIMYKIKNITTLGSEKIVVNVFLYIFNKFIDYKLLKIYNLYQINYY